MKLKVLKERISYEVYDILETGLSIFPGTLGMLARRIFYKCYLKKCGSSFKTGLRVRIQAPRNINIGKNVGLNYGVWIAANSSERGNISIGDNVLIGPYSILHSGNHKFGDPNTCIIKQGYDFSPIRINNDVWIAARCTILSGVTIGEGAVLAAGSVITRDVLPYDIVAGVPGKSIGSRK